MMHFPHLEGSASGCGREDEFLLAVSLLSSKRSMAHVKLAYYQSRTEMSTAECRYLVRNGLISRETPEP